MNALIHVLRRTALLGLLFAAGASAMSGCKKDPGSGELTVTPEGEITFAAEGEKKSLLVVTESGWSASINEAARSWLSHTTTDRNLVLTAVKNTSMDERTAEVTVSAGSATRKITVVQRGQTQTIVLEPANLPAVPWKGNEYGIVVTTTPHVDLNYNLGPGVDWITLGTFADGALNITVKENPGNRRTGTVVFSDRNGNASSAVLNVIQLANGVDEVVPEGYTLRSSMKADASMVGLGFEQQIWKTVDTYMKTKGFDYTENPNAATGDHNTETHILVESDEELDQSVFHLFSHSHAGAVDGDRGPAVGGDRMRNEMKSRTGDGWHQMNGNYGEWQILEWKMKIPTGWQPTGSFCHIHQLKGQQGSDIGAPVITITLRSQSGVRHLEVIHTPRNGGVKVNNPVDNIKLDDIEGQWLQVRQECNFKRAGFYRLRITRVSDESVVVDKSVSNIDLWREGGCIDVRNKFGIYRSYDITGTLTSGQLPNLKDESIYLADFKVYEKPESANNENPQPVED